MQFSIILLLFSSFELSYSFQFFFFRQLFSIIIYFQFQFILLKFAYHFIVHLFQFTNLPNLLANYNPLSNFAFQIIKFSNFIHSN